MRRFEAKMFPQIGPHPVAEIRAPELVAMVEPIEARSVNDLTKRSLQTSGQVFRYAIAHGLAKRSQVTNIRSGDVLGSPQKPNLVRIDRKDLPELLCRSDRYQGAATPRRAVKLMAVTFVRTTELIGARWAEFYLKTARWDTPAEHMKMKAGHHRTPALGASW